VNLRAAAAAYIARGFRVVPLYGVTEQGRCRCGDPTCEQAIGKHTRLDIEERAKNGPPFAAADFSEGDNLALMMGPWGGGRDWLITLDFDVYSGDPSRSLPLPPTLRHTTPRGWHDIFTVPAYTPLGNYLDVLGTREREQGFGLDLRYARGRIVAPPSRGYRWVDEHAPIVELPREVIATILGERRRRGLTVLNRWEREKGKRP
jgi:hypothetical protein